jgi:hypothetical protein
MIFRPFLARAIFARLKTETRRLVKPGDEAFMLMNKIAAVRRNGRLTWKVNDGTIDWIGQGMTYSNAATHPATYRQPTYSIHMKRATPSVGRFRIPYILRERLQDITDEGVRMEGLSHSVHDPEAPFMPFDMPYSPSHLAFVDPARIDDGLLLPGPRAAFASLWDSINVKGHRWIDNPEVWVIGIVPVKDVQP